jgi:hypothetical protein
MTNTLDSTSLQDISLEDQLQVDAGGGFTSAEMIGIGMGMIGLGIGIAAAPIGAFGIGAAMALSAFGGGFTGSGLSMRLHD